MRHSQKIKRYFVTLFVVMCSAVGWAYTFEHEGIYYYVLSNSENTVAVTYKSTSYNSYSGDVKIPEYVEYGGKKYKVTEIFQRAFQSSTNLTSVSIPKTVSLVDKDAFYKCTNLKEIRFEDSDETLSLSYCYYSFNNGSYSGSTYGSLFVSCPLEILYLGRNISYDLDKSGKNPFKNKTQIKTVTIGKHVTSLGDMAFNGCTGLENIYFYSNPTIGTDAIPSTATCHLALDDNNNIDFNTANANTYADASYTRTISEGKYGTIILPFAPDAASLENYAFYALAESGDDYMKFEEVSSPVANTPYIYTLREGKENIAITGGETTISSTITKPTVDGWETLGSFTNQSIDTSNGYYYALSATENEINRITKNLIVLPYRAYFTSANASKSVLSIYLSGTTGVEKISSSDIDGFENGAIFDLSGRKVTEPTKGHIYIKDGKKIMF